VSSLHKVLVSVTGIGRDERHRRASNTPQISIATIYVPSAMSQGPGIDFINTSCNKSNLSEFSYRFIESVEWANGPC